MPPETEQIPQVAPSVPPALRPSFESSGARTSPDAAKPQAVPLAGSVAEAKSLLAAAEQAPTANTIEPGKPGTAEPEPERIHDEFARLRDDAGARRAFYDGLRYTVEQVRAGNGNARLPPKGWARFRPPSNRVSSHPAAPVHPPASPESR